MAWSGLYLPSIDAHNFTFQENTVKKLRLFLSSVALTVLLSVSASAGIITTAGSQPPPPPPPAPTSMTTESETAEAEGVMSTGIATPEVVGEITVGLVQSILTLF